MTKMRRRRKIAVIIERSESDEDSVEDTENDMQNSTLSHGPMFSIMCNIQNSQALHNRCVKEMQQLYCKMDHDAFMYTFIRMIKSAMEAEEANEYAKTTLTFCAKYVTSYDTEDTHPVLIATFDWLLTTISNDPHIRFRLCQFVNMILNALGTDAALDDCICDHIMSYMIHRLRDLIAGVRVQAILALQRLQMPANPDDVIVKTYLFHLNSDPSPKVRQAVITSIGKNYNTIPYIIDRLWDVDEKVRRHTYLHMSSVSAKVYKVSQRLTFLEQGLSDRSEMVKKAVTTVMLPQWLGTYNKDFIAFISALKLDANEVEMDRFRKITKVVLPEMFLKEKIEDLVKVLPLETEGGFYKCIPFEKLTVELSLYWLSLIEFLQSRMEDELDLIIPELSTFCSYVLQYCKSAKVNMDKWAKLEYNYIILTLMEIVLTFDLGDEIGRENLKQLLSTLLKNYQLEEKVIEVITRCTENLITNQEQRLEFFVDIIKELTEQKNMNMTEFNEMLEKQTDKTLKLKLSTLKVKILDLHEQEMNYVEQKEYAKAQSISDERTACWEEYWNLIKPFSSDESSQGQDMSRSMIEPKKVTTETITKCLQVAFHMIVSKKVKSLTPKVCDLYKEFIRRHIESIQAPIRDWALKCGTAFSMLYDQLSKDVYTSLYEQFFKNQNTRIWKTSIDCIFELLDRYGFAHFEIEDKQNKTGKAGRLLYSSEYSEEEETTTPDGGVIFMMSHFLDTCEDVTITSAVVNGFCRLVLHGHIKNDDIIEKLLLKYFNPVTEPEINQILGVFFENLIVKRKQDLIQRSLLPTVRTILGAPYDSPLHEIKPDTVIKFVIDSTRPVFCGTGVSIHSAIAQSFMQEMLNNITNKELIKYLAKELSTLEMPSQGDTELKKELLANCEKILEANLEFKLQKYIKGFKDVLEGNAQPVNPANANEGDASDEDDNHSKNNDETENAQSDSPKRLEKKRKVPSSPSPSKAKANGDRTVEEVLSEVIKDVSQTAMDTSPAKSPQAKNREVRTPKSPVNPNQGVFVPMPGSLRKSLNPAQRRSIASSSQNVFTPPGSRILSRTLPARIIMKTPMQMRNEKSPSKVVQETKKTKPPFTPIPATQEENKDKQDKSVAALPELVIDESVNESTSKIDGTQELSHHSVAEEVPLSPQNKKTAAKPIRVRPKRGVVTSIKGKNTELSNRRASLKRRLALSMSPRNSSGDEKTKYVPNRKQQKKRIDISDKKNPTTNKNRDLMATSTPNPKNKDRFAQEPPNSFKTIVISKAADPKSPVKLTTPIIARTRGTSRKEYQSRNTMTRSKSALLTVPKMNEAKRTSRSLSNRRSSRSSKAEEKSTASSSTSGTRKPRRRLLSQGSETSNDESLASELPRRRGRPSKNKSLSSPTGINMNKTSTDINTNRTPNEQKRGRGRPSNKSLLNDSLETNKDKTPNNKVASNENRKVKDTDKKLKSRRDKENQQSAKDERKSTREVQEPTVRKSARKKVPIKSTDFV